MPRIMIEIAYKGEKHFKIRFQQIIREKFGFWNDDVNIHSFLL